MDIKRLQELSGMEVLTESLVETVFNKYKKQIAQEINSYTKAEYDAVIDWNNPEQAEMALDELFSVISGEMEHLLDEADKDGMIGEWFEG